MKLIDNGAPIISVAQVEFEQAAKQYQEQAAYNNAQAARYMMLSSAIERNL